MVLQMAVCRLAMQGGGAIHLWVKSSSRLVEMANPAMVNMPCMGMYTARETIELVSRAGVIKGNMRPERIFISAVSGGCLLAFAGAAYLSVTTAPWYQENAPGLLRMVGAFIFPLGLVMIV